MQFFTGTSEKTVDAKNRIQLPSRMRDGVDPSREGVSLYVTLGNIKGTLWILPETAFRMFVESIKTESMSKAEEVDFKRGFFSIAEVVDMDKQGRLVLPERLVAWARLDKDVYVVGNGEHIEIWNRPAYLALIGFDPSGDEWPDWLKAMTPSPGKARMPSPEGGGS